MGLTDAWGRLAVRHAHVLVAELPGYWMTRVAVERQVLARGWRLARSPADADILAVCGPPRPPLAQSLTRVWEQVPGPRTRVEVHSPRAVLAALDTAAADLLDTAAQRADGRDRTAEHGGTGRGGRRGGSTPDAYGHAGHHEPPHGIPLAVGGEDRDGLEMDLLRLRLGPVLAYWPAGLVVGCALQGDVIVDAEASLVGVDDATTVAADAPVTDDPRRFAARRCDNAVSLLGLAGWDDAASRARRIRDALLFNSDPDRPARELDRLRRRVGRSWWLRWSLRRLGPLDGPELARRGLPATAVGDVRDRLLAILDRAADSIAGRHPAGPPRRAPVEALPDLVRGWDVATARLIVASLDLEPLVTGREVSRV
ncbi:hypothetical protein [Micromonospora narathiwatensis]|uniref:Uncharacterized protein n=1 Tax=Micromonospora narathiwatensis TaxID=299146 RepID=A0A1A8ZG08_9ACTN|nr:hypothetical protein [Micromonospora narathiwatensis]SBT42773.1 hypothetical protein GA0070621_1604 [Micromonospora narathiwatensis]